MSHSPADIICEVLHEELSTVDPKENPRGPWPVYVAQMQTDPANAIVVTDNGRPTDGRAMKTKEVFAHYGFQVRVRSDMYRTGWAMIQEICEMLAHLVRKQIPVEDILYEVQSVQQLTTPVYMGTDPNNRFEFSVNFTTTFQKVVNDEN